MYNDIQVNSGSNVSSFFFQIGDSCPVSLFILLYKKANPRCIQDKNTAKYCKLNQQRPKR